MNPSQLKPALSVLALVVLSAASPRLRADVPNPVVHLWEGGAPGYESKKDVPEQPVQWGIAGIHNPSLTLFLPAPGKATGAAIVVLPGGGHRMLVIGPEGYTVGEFLAAHGIAGFVLKYRLAHDQTAPSSPYRIGVEELQDAQRAIRLVRSRAAEWGVDPSRIGILGFSAGGQLANLACISQDDGNPGAVDPVDRESSRLAFQVLVYPGGTEDIRPTRDSPPAFLLCGDEDNLSEGLVQACLRFKQAGVPVEFHLYSGVGHAFNLHPDEKRPVRTWPTLLYNWMDGSGFLKKSP
jgi:acetyl esterase/lipase